MKITEERSECYGTVTMLMWGGCHLSDHCQDAEGKGTSCKLSKRSLYIVYVKVSFVYLFTKVASSVRDGSESSLNLFSTGTHCYHEFGVWLDDFIDVTKSVWRWGGWWKVPMDVFSLMMQNVSLTTHTLQQQQQGTPLKTPSFPLHRVQ